MKRPPAKSSGASGAADERLEAVLAEISEKLRAGKSVDVERYCREDPECAEHIRNVWPAMQALAELGNQPSSIDLHQSGSGNLGSCSGALGDYRLIRELGRGGMGVVYEAEQISLERKVALKVLPFAATLDGRQLQRFKNEARAAACLDHPHIVDIYGVGCERGVHYYAMRLIEGHTLAETISELSQLLHANSQFPQSVSAVLSGRQQSKRTDRAGMDSERAGANSLAASSSHETDARAEPTAASKKSAFSAAYFRSVAELGAHVAEALDHAHHEAIIHRDIKPSNLMLDARGKVWVTDFGLALVETGVTLTLTGDLIGTLRYMSPEQALGGAPLDHRTDVYSLGATLYELLTLQPAFGGKGRQQLLRQIAMEEPKPARSVQRSIPAELEMIVAKAMEKDPADRYASAQAMADDLRRFLDHRPVRARRPTLLRRMNKWLHRRRTLVNTALLVLLTAVIGLAVNLVLIDHERDEAKRQRDEADRQRIAVEQREADLRRRVYAADMSRAWEAWQNGNLEFMAQLLDRYHPSGGEEDLRTFAWRYLRGLIEHQADATLVGHNGPVYHVAFSSNGDHLLASASADGTAKLWNVATGRLLATLESHQSGVNSVAFTPDGKTLATAGDDQTIRLWDVSTGKVAKTLTTPEWPVGRIRFAPEGDLLAAGHALTLEKAKTTLWRPSTGKQQASIPDSYPLAFSPDGETLALAGPDRSVRLWNPRESHHVGPVMSHGNLVHIAAFSPNGETIATAGKDIVIKVWDVSTGELQASCKGHLGGVQSLVFSADGNVLVSGSDDKTVRHWNPKTGRQRGIFQTAGRIFAVAFSPRDETLAAALSDGTIQLWRADAAPGRRSLVQHPLGVTSLAFSPDGETLITAAAWPEVLRWSAPDGHLVQRYLPARNDDVLCVDFSHDGKHLAFGAREGNVYVIDAATGAAKMRWKGAGRRTIFLKFIPGSDLLVWHIAGEGLQVWDWKAKKQVSCWRRWEDAHNLALSPDAVTLVASADQDVHIGNRKTGNTRLLKTQHAALVSCFAFSPEGKLLATGSDDHTIRIWNTATWREKAILLGHRGRIRCLAFSPDGATLVSGSEMGEVKLWDVRSAQELFALPGHTAAVLAAAFSPDGRSLVTGGHSANRPSELYLWPAKPP